MAYLFQFLLAVHVVSCRGELHVVFISFLVAVHVVSCRGELYVYETEWQFVSSPVEESWMCELVP